MFWIKLILLIILDYLVFRLVGKCWAEFDETGDAKKFATMVVFITIGIMLSLILSIIFFALILGFLGVR